MSEQPSAAVIHERAELIAIALIQAGTIGDDQQEYVTSVIERMLTEIADRPICCLDNTHTQHWSDGYTQTCKTHSKKRTTDTGWNR